jgi:hypothetical protein
MPPKVSCADIVILVLPSDDFQAGTSSSGTVVVNQQLQGISMNHGDFVLAGGNVHISHHHNYPTEPKVNILSVLRLVRNLRLIHLDVLSKATPGTGIWLLKTEKFILWLDLNGNLKILWGTGIRESLLGSPDFPTHPLSQRALARLS